VAAASGRRARLDPAPEPGSAVHRLDGRPGRSVLAGHVNGLAPAAQVQAVFDSWRRALVLEGYREHRGVGGTGFLHAAATVFADEPEAGQ
jgi:hypothetical protein